MPRDVCTACMLAPPPHTELQLHLCPPACIVGMQSKSTCWKQQRSLRAFQICKAPLQLLMHVRVACHDRGRACAVAPLRSCCGHGRFDIRVACQTQVVVCAEQHNRLCPAAVVLRVCLHFAQSHDQCPPDVRTEVHARAAACGALRGAAPIELSLEACLQNNASDRCRGAALAKQYMAQVQQCIGVLLCVLSCWGSHHRSCAAVCVICCTWWQCCTLCNTQSAQLYINQVRTSLTSLRRARKADPLAWCTCGVRSRFFWSLSRFADSTNRSQASTGVASGMHARRAQQAQLTTAFVVGAPRLEPRDGRSELARGCFECAPRAANPCHAGTRCEASSSGQLQLLQLQGIPRPVSAPKEPVKDHVIQSASLPVLHPAALADRADGAHRPSMFESG